MLVTAPSLEAPTRPWHVMTPVSVLDTLGASDAGLSTADSVPALVGQTLKAARRRRPATGDVR